MWSVFSNSYFGDSGQGRPLDFSVWAWLPLVSVFCSSLEFCLHGCTPLFFPMGYLEKLDGISMLCIFLPFSNYCFARLVENIDVILSIYFYQFYDLKGLLDHLCCNTTLLIFYYRN